MLLIFMTLPTPVLAASPKADRYVEDKFIFAGKSGEQPVLLVLTISRGTSDREGHKYTTECTGHIFRRDGWLHIGPGLYEWPETSLVIIPSGPGFTVDRSGTSAGYDIEVHDRIPAVQLRTGQLRPLYSDTADADYCQHYTVGQATAIVGTDTISGNVFQRRLDLAGYNRLAGNTGGYFPGLAELTFLTGDSGLTFVFVTDQVIPLDAGNRLRTNFAIAHLPRSDTVLVCDSLITQWPEVDDTSHPGKPVPQRWRTEVGGGSWSAEYRDRGHFFYFTGFGVFGVKGTVQFADSLYQVIGVVEHIHARDNPR
jgi:hypothetical protein